MATNGNILHRFFWLDGAITSAYGSNSAEAMAELGMSSSDLPHLHFIATGENSHLDWAWDTEEETWVQVMRAAV